MRTPSLLGFVVVMACGQVADPKEQANPAPEVVALPQVAKTETVVDQASLAALCMRASLSLSLSLEGAVGTGVLASEKDRTERYGWVAGELVPSAFDKLSAEQAARMLEVHLKTADATRAQYAATCTEAVEGAEPVLLTFTVEQGAAGRSAPPGFWVVAGDRTKRSIVFLPGASAQAARARALEFATASTHAAQLRVGETLDRGQGSQLLCPKRWCDDLTPDSPQPR